MSKVNLSEHRRINGLKPYDAWSTVYIFDRIALPIARFCAKIHLSPNLITLTAIAMSILAIYFSITSNYIIAVALMNLSTICDCIDGKVARLNDLQSKFGANLDKMSDLIAHSISPLIVGVFMYSHGQIIAGLELIIVAIVMTRAHIKGMTGMKPIFENDKSRNRKWKKWCDEHGLYTEPFSETELAFLLPSLVLIEIANSIPPVASATIIIGYIATKIWKIISSIT